MILEVTLQQQQGQQLCINRWNYVGSGTPIGVTMSQALITAMGGVWTPGSPGSFPADTIIQALWGLQSNEIFFIQMVARNIYPSADFYELPYPAGLAGGVVAASLSPFTAYGFSTNRVTTAIRRGQKRFAGVPANAVGSGGAIAGATLPGLVDLAALMTDTLSYTDGGNSLSFVPTIVHKEKYTTPAGNDAYRYYSTEAVQMTHVAQGFVWAEKDHVRSQTSRQYGRGA